MFSILGWVVFGLVVGAVAKFVMPGKDPGGLLVTMARWRLASQARSSGAFLVGCSAGTVRENRPGSSWPFLERFFFCMPIGSSRSSAKHADTTV